MPSSLESIRRALSLLRETRPDREVVFLAEAFVSGFVSLKMGAELPEGYGEMPRSVSVVVTPPPFNTAERGVAGLGLPFDTSEAVQMRNIVMTQLFGAILQPLVDYANFTLRCRRVYKDINTIHGDPSPIWHAPWDASLMAHDTVLQMSVPSLEYSRDGLPSHYRFGGTPPPKPLAPNFQLPPWFAEIERNSAKLAMSHPHEKSNRKKIVATAQGTFVLNYNDVIVPTINALADRDDFLVVAILGVKGANLTSYFPGGLPQNTIVADYFPYDPIIEHVDVFMTNGSNIMLKLTFLVLHRSNLIKLDGE